MIKEGMLIIVAALCLTRCGNGSNEKLFFLLKKAMKLFVREKLKVVIERGLGLITFRTIAQKK